MYFIILYFASFLQWYIWSDTIVGCSGAAPFVAWEDTRSFGLHHKQFWNFTNLTSKWKKRKRWQDANWWKTNESAVPYQPFCEWSKYIFKDDKYLCMYVRTYTCMFNCVNYRFKISLLKGRSLITSVWYYVDLKSSGL